MSKIKKIVDKIRKDFDLCFNAVDPNIHKYYWENITSLGRYPNWMVVPASAKYTNRTFGKQYDLELPFLIYNNIKDNEANKGYDKSIDYIGEFTDAILSLDSEFDYVLSNLVLNQRFSTQNPTVLSSAVQINVQVNFNKCVNI